jgi:DNA-nicking Smr family endonuclease
VSPESDSDRPDDPAVILPLTGELDLHAFAARDVPSVVEEYVRACREAGLLELRIVHGRGRGVQRAVVRRLLSSLPAVASFADAAPASGGWGATRVRLHPVTT